MAPSSLRKAAVLLLSLPDQQAAPLLEQLRPAELAALASEIARRQVPLATEQTAVIDELISQRTRGNAGAETKRNSLDTPNQSGRRSAASVAAKRQLERFSYLRNVDSQTVRYALRDEHLQTVALVLNHLPTAQRDRVLCSFSPPLAANIVRRLDALGQVRAEVVDDVERGLEQNLAMALGKWLPEAA
jgi:flagellar motor switch protein FliG